MSEPNQSHTTGTLVHRIYHTYLKERWGILFPALIAMALAAAMTAAFAALIQPIMDDIFIEGRRHLIIPIAVAVFACFLVRGLSTYAHTLLIHMLGQGVVAQIQKDLFSRLLSMDMAFFKSHNSGTLTAHMVSDVQLMRGAVADTLTGIGRNLLTLVFLIGVMVWRDPLLALGALTLFPLATWFVIFLGRKLRKISNQTQDSIGTLTTLLTEVFQSVRQVKSFGQEEFEKQRISRTVDKLKTLNLKIIRIGNLSTPVNDLIVGAFVAGLIVYGGVQIADGQTTPGQLMSFISAFLMAYEPMKKLAKLNNNLQVGLAAADRVFGLVDSRPEITDRPGAVPLKAQDMAVEFDDVSFAYDGEEGEVLKAVSLSVEPGQIIALVGPSGSGKTTLLNLIPRFYETTSGKISVNDRPIEDYTLESLRAHIALVSQEITLFDGTVADNIAYGLAGASKDSIIKAAKAANAHDFIDQMEQGYDTPIGEGGARLSGGQRQRIAIARAILKDAPVLLLDEATSALDTESEQLVQDSLGRLKGRKSMFVIAHRLSTVRQADRILVLDQGRVIEEGTHEELLAKKGAYANLCATELRE